MKKKFLLKRRKFEVSADEKGKEKKKPINV